MSLRVALLAFCLTGVFFVGGADGRRAGAAADFVISAEAAKTIRARISDAIRNEEEARGDLSPDAREEGLLDAISDLREARGAMRSDFASLVAGAGSPLAKAGASLDKALKHDQQALRVVRNTQKFEREIRLALSWKRKALNAMPTPADIRDGDVGCESDRAPSTHGGSEVTVGGCSKPLTSVVLRSETPIEGLSTTIVGEAGEKTGSCRHPPGEKHSMACRFIPPLPPGDFASFRADWTGRSELLVIAGKRIDAQQLTHRTPTTSLEPGQGVRVLDNMVCTYGGKAGDTPRVGCRLTNTTGRPTSFGFGFGFLVVTVYRFDPPATVTDVFERQQPGGQPSPLDRDVLRIPVGGQLQIGDSFRLSGTDVCCRVAPGVANPGQVGVGCTIAKNGRTTPGSYTAGVDSIGVVVRLNGKIVFSQPHGS